MNRNSVHPEGLCINPDITSASFAGGKKLIAGFTSCHLYILYILSPQYHMGSYWMPRMEQMDAAKAL